MPKTLPMIDMSAPVCCAPVAAGPMSDDDALHVALRLKALADPARVKIMSYLFSSSAGEENSGDLAAALGLTESTVSHHLTQLRRAGLVESERRGMNVYHRPHRDALGALCAVLDPNCCILRLLSPLRFFRVPATSFEGHPRLREGYLFPVYIMSSRASPTHFVWQSTRPVLFATACYFPARIEGYVDGCARFALAHATAFNWMRN